MAAPSDRATEAFLHLVDLLDAEANTVVHAVVRAKAAVRSMVDDSRALLEWPTDDGRTWAVATLRLMRQRATLVEALASLSPSDGETKIDAPRPITGVSLPVPPRPIRHPAPLDGRSDVVIGGGLEARPMVVMPVPPRPRYRLLQQSEAGNP